MPTHAHIYVYMLYICTLQVAPGTLDALMPALGEHPSLTVPRGRGEVVIDCSKVSEYHSL
jgi:hypothetical protein